ncbi:MAG TPA: MarC family protein [Caulobacteraceae bacterium]|jgi:multiple antibiotic resistance protein|nr:MarC family protein [Caulobacteraceae bacterium]
MAATFAINFFIALFALIDPVGNVPLYAAATVGASAAQSRLIAIYMALFSLAFLAFFFVTGLALLRFFGISLPAFRIAGGIVLLLMGLDMVRGDIVKTFADAESAGQPLSTRAYAARRFEALIVPFGMPLLIGPGAISSAVIYAEEAKGLGASGTLIGLAVITAISLTIVLSFWFTSQISRAMGRVGMVIVVRVLGLLLTAMAVQFILAGWAASTTGAVRHDVAQPYQAARGQALDPTRRRP